MKGPVLEYASPVRRGPKPPSRLGFGVVLALNIAIFLAGVVLLVIVVFGNDGRDEVAAAVGAVLLTFLAATWWVAGTGVYLLYAAPAPERRARAALHLSAALGLAFAVLDLVLAV